MKKKYLKTVEDVVALKDTDTKIYAENVHGYYQFVNGVWCAFDDDGAWSMCPLTCEEEELYILEEEPEQEATTDDIGKLCWFYTDDDDNVKDIRDIGILTGMPYKEGDSRHYKMDNIYYYKHCRRLSPAEVAEITGYGVTEDGSRFYGEPFRIVGKEK